MSKVALFIDNLNVGGIQKSIVNMLSNLDLTKYDIDLYLFSKESFYDIPKNVNVIYLKKPSKILKFIPFSLAKKIYKPQILAKEYDVAIDFDSYQMSTAIGALGANSKKKVIWVHNDIKIKLQEELKYRILYFFFKKKYLYFDTYCAVSVGALASFRELHNYPNKNYLVIPNIIDTKEIYEKLQEDCPLKLDKKKVNIVTVGRLCHQKGIDIMLENIHELLEYRKDFHLYIIGDGPDKEALIKMVNDLTLNDFVTFLGNQKNPFKYLKSMDLFYLQSRYEGQGMVILEALSVGLDILIPKHLEKYCPGVTSQDDVLESLKTYKKTNHYKKFNNLEDYNNTIITKLNNLFDNKEV